MFRGMYQDLMMYVIRYYEIDCFKWEAYFKNHTLGRKPQFLSSGFMYLKFLLDDYYVKLMYFPIYF